MKKKMYILRTWTWENEDLNVDPKNIQHSTKLSVYIANQIYPVPREAPYITTSRLFAKKNLMLKSSH